MEDQFDKDPELVGSTEEPEIYEEVDEDALEVLVNAGFGGRSYTCAIRSDNTMTLPEALVREMGMKPGDALDWSFDENEGVIYIKVRDTAWEAPDWLQE